MQESVEQAPAGDAGGAEKKRTCRRRGERGPQRSDDGEDGGQQKLAMSCLPTTDQTGRATG